MRPARHPGRARVQALRCARAPPPRAVRVSSCHEVARVGPRGQGSRSKPGDRSPRSSDPPAEARTRRRLPEYPAATDEGGQQVRKETEALHTGVDKDETFN